MASRQRQHIFKLKVCCSVSVTEGVDPALHAIASIQNPTSHLINSDTMPLISAARFGAIWAIFEPFGDQYSIIQSYLIQFSFFQVVNMTVQCKMITMRKIHSLYTVGI